MKEVEIDEVMKLRHPEIVVMVVTKSAEGKTDITLVGWAMLGITDPRTWVLGIATNRYSHKAILDTKEFTVCIPSFEQKDDVIYTGNVSCWDEDKIPNTKLKLLPATKISTPLIEDSIACYECKLVNQMSAPGYTLFLGEIVAGHISGKNNSLLNLGNKKYVELKRGRWPYKE